jgi:alpha-beta hydrolase superfamily lysophospholipase
LTDPEWIREIMVTQDLWFTAADGVRLRGLLHGAAEERLVVLVPGFTGHADTPAVRRTAARLAARVPVLVLELRGHGRSGGRSTVGDAEVLDLDAAVRWARAHGVTRLATVGFSLGGSVVIRQAGLAARGRSGTAGGRGGTAAGGRSGTARRSAELGPDAVVAVSAPSRWYIRDTPVMRRLHPLVETRGGRLVARAGFRVRLAAGWTAVPPSPLEVVGDIAPTPLLLVHGDADTYFPVEHPHMLAAAAGPGVTLRIVPGFGHAENSLTPALVDELGDWVTTALTGPGPAGRCGSIEG